MLSLLLSVQRRPQRDDAGIRVNPKEIFFALRLKDVGHFSVWVMVEIAGTQCDDGWPDGQWLTDSGVVDGLLEDGPVVVDVFNRDLLKFETVK